MSAYIRDQFEELGAAVQTLNQDEAGNHLIADWGDGDEQVLILCHMDTVWPKGTLKVRPFQIENGLAYGPGILDMKAGIANSIHALKAIRSPKLKTQQRVRLLFNSDEEVGSPTSRLLIELEAKRSTHVFCLAPAPLTR